MQQLAERDGFALDDDAQHQALQRLGWLSPYYLEKLVDEIVPSGVESLGIPPTSVSAQLDRLLNLGLLEKCALSRSAAAGYQLGERYQIIPGTLSQSQQNDGGCWDKSPALGRILAKKARSIGLSPLC